MENNNKLRCYFVIDMKSFFASVEYVERGLNPMEANLVVADETRTDKTVCLAVTPSMKKLGVRNRCRLFEIPKNIDFIIAPPRMKKYIEYASKIYGIYLNYISKDDIHVYSIDECILDVTNYLKLYNLRAKEFAKKLMDEILNTLGIPSTTGIGTNMYLAKIALDIAAKKSPDRIGWLTEEKFIKELWNHKPLNDFWGISYGTVARLEKFGITDMKGIANCDENLLYKEFGINAELLIDHAYGRESCLMEDIKNYKGKSSSISNSQILPFGYKYQDAKIVMKEMIQEGCYRLARSHKSTELLHLYISYEGDKQITAKGTKRLNSATNLFSQIEPNAEELFNKIVNKNKLIRRIAYDFSDLINEDLEQYDFFTDVTKIKKEKKATKAVLNIKEKFGKNSILKGMDYQPNATQKERNQQIGGHKSGENENAKNK